MTTLDPERVTGRLDDKILSRFLALARRIVLLCSRMDKDRRPRRINDQLIGAGTSPCAQMYEAHEALSRADFSKSVGIAVKELSEARFWLLLVLDLKWFTPQQIAPLLDETTQLLKIAKSIRARSRIRRSPQ